jgi:glycosyltransferase involved in cell wall biosynthesis
MQATKLLLVLDSHPVQYRVPVWQRLDELKPQSIHVIYASDCSVRGHTDEDFGRKVAWDIPMLDGYSHIVINSENGVPLSGWNSLTGRNLRRSMICVAPDAVLLTGLNYRFDLAALLYAKQLGIPVWLRCENQDDAIHRGLVKKWIRTLIYRSLYCMIDRFFYIGNLNRDHYQKHGVSAEKLVPAYYATIDRFCVMSRSDKNQIRQNARSAQNIRATDFVIGFSGKFIPKKNPDLLFHMLPYLGSALRKRTVLYFLGSGPMAAEMEEMAATALEKWNVRSYFAGFANQSEIAKHYLAMDVLVLPSRRQGETWGLVANEAMQAGCGVVVSDAVGCSANFRSLERFEVFKEASESGLAASIERLSKFDRSFDWAEHVMAEYSLENVAQAFLKSL